MESLNWPLMHNNITKDDLNVLIEFLKTEPILTQSTNVRAFEEEFSNWVGVKHGVFVNSGASANLISMAALRYLHGPGEVLVPTITWVSDIASIYQTGHTPVFVDIDPRTLSMNVDETLAKITSKTRAVFLTHLQGFNGVTDKLLDELKKRNIPLIEDVCESHGANLRGRKAGSMGWMSNFSYYYAHHMSTIEGGMVCMNDEKLYQTVRMFRSHGMVREMTDAGMKQEWHAKHPDLTPDFIFAYPAYNMRNTEIGAVIGRNQLKRLDLNNEKRRKNFSLFLSLLDPEKYWTDFELEGSVNYAFNLVIRKADDSLRDRVVDVFKKSGVEIRRGSSGGGNQLRQPYLRGLIPADEHKKYPVSEHVHFYGFYFGNYPDLEEQKIRALCERLNKVV